jgi:hypothetical protein
MPHHILRLLDIQNIVENCPSLEDFTIQLLRTRGGAEEVAKYRTIGSLSKLRRLYLILDPTANIQVVPIGATPDASFKLQRQADPILMNLTTN